MQLKKVLAPLVFTTAFALAGSPSAPLATAVPTVGGNAHAYAPCAYLLLQMQGATFRWKADPSFRNFDAMVEAVWDYYDGCVAP